MMSQDRLMKVLLAPVVSEKSTMVGVVPDATKQEVKAAVELLFKVQVDSVQMVNVKGKTAHFGRFAGKHSDVRKAYVTLKSGQEINFAEVK